MLLDKHYAVVFKVRAYSFTPVPDKVIMTENAWIHLQEMAKEGHFVILECWDITKGKCISN